MVSQHCLKNIALTSDKRNNVSNSLLTTFGNKCIQLKVLKDTTSMYRDGFTKIEKIMEEEKQKLEELNSKLWSSKDSFCNEVWQFSQEHDFSIIFKHHPFVIKTPSTKQINYDKNDVEIGLDLINLINEIDIIRTEIFNIKYEKNIKQNLEDALTSLQKLQLISEDIIELLRLISSPESSCKSTTISMLIYDVIPNYKNKCYTYKQCKNSNFKDLRSNKSCSKQKESTLKNTLWSKNSEQCNKKLDSVSIKNEMDAIQKNYPQLSLEKSIVFTATTAVTDISRNCTNNGTVKNFTVKKRSEISLKFEQRREHK